MANFCTKCGKPLINGLTLRLHGEDIIGLRFTGRKSDGSLGTGSGESPGYSGTGRS